ncbi:MAG TPA: hypothetical protein VFO73_03085, partial [Candidatus Limnocylindrales bacterium]|nr:hypothetical protein [Candidatus Limnocylindrales bacterium]
MLFGAPDRARTRALVRGDASGARFGGPARSESEPNVPVMGIWPETEPRLFPDARPRGLERSRD